jgi:hypothetical protein
VPILLVKDAKGLVEILDDAGLEVIGSPMLHSFDHHAGVKRICYEREFTTLKSTNNALLLFSEGKIIIFALKLHDFLLAPHQSRTVSKCMRYTEVQR